MNTEQLKRFVTLEARRKELEQEIDTIRSEAAEFEESLMPQFEQEGVDRISVDGRTV